MPPQRYVLRKLPAAEWKQWDQFVNEHPRGHFLQSWGWGELKANGGWYPLRLALMDEQEQQIVAAAQVLCRTPAHLPLWTGHLAYIPKGPVIDWSQPRLCQAFFTQLNAYLRQRGALALRMEPNQEVKALEQVPMTASSIVGEPCLWGRHESPEGSHPRLLSACMAYPPPTPASSSVLSRVQWESARGFHRSPVRQEGHLTLWCF